MAEYIDRRPLFDALYDADAITAKGINIFRNFPTADVRPVVKAKWEWNDNNGYYYCGNCGAVSPREDQDGDYCDCPNYCPNCGADMREES